MARYTRQVPGAGEAGWDAKINDNFLNLFVRPIPIPIHSGDESNLQSTYPANQYDRCLIWVNDTVEGWVIYISNGTTWEILETGGGGGPLVIQTLSAAGSINDDTGLAICSGTTYTATLPAASGVPAGTLIHIKRTSSGTITVGSAGGNIDGSSTFSLSVALSAISVVSDGTNWHIV